MLIIRPRPESIGEGTRRLYTSDKLKKADPDLVARINLVTQELEDIACELAHRAGRKTNRQKKRRTDGPNELRDSTEQAGSSSHMGVSHSPEVHSITPAGDILQLLPTLHSPSIEKVLDQLYFHITDHFLLDVTFVGSKFPRQLLQIAWHILDSGGSLSRIVQIICSFVLIFKRSTDQFRTAGAESFFSDPRLLPAISEQDATGGSARRIQDALCRLRGNVQ